MNETEQKEFRRRLGALVLTEQTIAAARGDKPADAVPVILTTLLSLAAFIAKTNTGLSSEEFVHAATTAAEDEWKLLQ